ncbi:MAG: sigma-54 dependent transcriptional regulator [Pseudomonadota bacterium]
MSTDMSASILIVDDELRYRQLYTQVLESAGFRIHSAASAEAALGMIRKSVPAMVITDMRMDGADGIDLLKTARREHPTLPFLLVTAYTDVRDAVNAMRLGVVDYLSKPVDLDELLAAVRDTVGIDNETYGSEPCIPPDALKGIVAESHAMRCVLQDAYRVARSDANVLLMGESGTGKEVLADFIHRNSLRRNKTMVTLNCAAIPATLLASELFGHEKGAFTGAVAGRKGRFREAHGSTLFLDEIGEMPLELQPTLLRAIETNRVTPLGSDIEIEVDYRLIAATNRGLSADVESGHFRRDLYYRLNVIAIEIPPLRERIEDILPLARFFLSQGKLESKRLSRAAAQMLLAHPWPGNVRELANAIERVRLLSQTDVILPEHLPPAVRQAVSSTQTPVAAGKQPIRELQASLKTLEESEMEVIRHTLEQTGGNRTKAAEFLGITRRGLIYKLKRLGIG